MKSLVVAAPSASHPQLTPLTPPGRGAVATLAVWGTGADALVQQFFQPANGKLFAEQAIGSICFGRFAEEELVVCRRGADDLEIHCHGGIAAITAITNMLTAAGGHVVAAAEYWQQRTNDPLQMEILAALTQARTEFAAVQLWRMAQGDLERELNEISADLQHGKVAAAIPRLSALSATYPIARHLTEPFHVVLCGRPNVGKSSLLNALVGYERAIVFDQPGTTRDVLTATTVIDGWVVEFSDTAGLRDSGDPIEQAGMEQAQSQIAAADLVLLVVDASAPEFPAAIVAPSKSLLVWNKIDLLPSNVAVPTTAIATNAITGGGLAELHKEIVRSLVPISLEGRPFIFTPRQVELVEGLLITAKSQDSGLRNDSK